MKTKSMAFQTVPAALALNASIIFGTVTAPGVTPYAIANTSSAVQAALLAIFNATGAPSGDAQRILKSFAPGDRDKLQKMVTDKDILEKPKAPPVRVVAGALPAQGSSAPVAAAAACW